MSESRKSKIAEAFPVSEYVADELKARGWTLDDLVDHMPGDWNENRCAMDLVMYSDDPEILLGQEMADALGAAFGTNPQIWMNLDLAYREFHKGKSLSTLEDQK